MMNPDTKTSLIERSKDVFKDFTYVDYKNISKDDINYLPLHIRQPFDVEDLLINQIPNDMCLLMQQGIIRPLIIMVTEQWDLFDTFAWEHNKFDLTPDFGNVPYSKMVRQFTGRAIPEENITWLVPMDFHLKQIAFLKDKGYKITVKFIQYDYFLKMLQPIAEKHDITKRQFKNHFLCLCQGTPRNHRFGLVYELWREGLINNGVVSCGNYQELNESKQSNWIDDEVTTSAFMSNFDGWSHNADNFKGKLPLVFDDMSNRHWDKGGPLDEHHIFLDSFLWIASETKKMHDGVYITEKTWKPIAYGSPFCVNGDNGSIDYLHKRGFKTFHEFWDESYDHMNDVDKIKQIRDILKKICSMDINQINALYEKMIPILEHNRQTLIKNTQHDNLVRELSNG